MKLLFALGNPSKAYDGTRHNVAFQALDSYANKLNIAFVGKSKFSAEIAELTVDGEKILLAKPTTFYNDVGTSYRLVLDYYNIDPEDSLVIHDELALPLGTLRIREGGSDAGNNGIKSINQHGGRDSKRLRIGVGSDQRNMIGDTAFVLGKFSKTEDELLTQLIPTAHAFIDDFIAGRLSVTSHSHRD